MWRSGERRVCSRSGTLDKENASMRGWLIAYDFYFYVISIVFRKVLTKTRYMWRSVERGVCSGSRALENGNDTM